MSDLHNQITTICIKELDEQISSIVKKIRNTMKRPYKTVLPIRVWHASTSLAYGIDGFAGEVIDKITVKTTRTLRANNLKLGDDNIYTHFTDIRKSELQEVSLAEHLLLERIHLEEIDLSKFGFKKESFETNSPTSWGTRQKILAAEGLGFEIRKKVCDHARSKDPTVFDDFNSFLIAGVEELEADPETTARMNTRKTSLATTGRKTSQRARIKKLNKTADDLAAVIHDRDKLPAKEMRDLLEKLFTLAAEALDEEDVIALHRAALAVRVIGS